MKRSSRVSTLASAAGALGAIAAFLACGGGGSSSSSGSGGNGACTIAGGMYTVHYTPASGSGAQCPAIPDQTQTLTANQNPASIMMGTMTSDAGVTCTSSGSGCTAMLTCSNATNTIQISFTATVGNNSISGHETETINIPAAGVTVSCSYSFTFTPA